MSQWPEGRFAVGVCFSEHPGEFFCQVASRAEELDQLMNELAEVAESLPPLEQVARGTVCCGQFTEDDGWYRARVISVDDSLVTVQYVDYGNTEQLSAQRLRRMPEKFVRPPVHAQVCRLAGIAPAGTDGQWSSAAVDKFRATTPVDAEFMAEVVSSGGNAPTSIHLYAGNQSIGQQLVQERLARAANDTAAPFATENLSVSITFTSSPSEFWYQTGDVSKLEQLMDYLAETYGSGSSAVSRLSSPQLGDWCCVQSTEDGLWYRAVITNLTPFTVRLLDYGNLDHPDNVMELTEKAASLPPQAAQGCMFGVRSSVAAMWSTAACDEFAQLCNFGEEVFSAVRHGGVYFELKTSAGQSVSELLVRQGHAVLERDIGNMASLTPQLPPTLASSNLAMGSSDWHDVVLSHVESTACFYVQLCKNHQVLKDLTQRMASAAANTPAPSRALSVGSLCLAQFDGEWYRGQILASESGRCQVFFLDFGNTEWIPLTSIRAILQWACVEPRQAIRCSLAGFTAMNRAANDALQSYVAKRLILVAQLVSRGVRGQHALKLVDTTSEPNKDILVSDAIKSPSSTSQSAPAPSQVSVQSFKYPVCGSSPLTGTVTHCVSPSEIYVSLDSMQEDLDTVMTELKECGPSLRRLSRYEPGTPCCAIFSADEGFYRAKLTTGNSSGSVGVQYVDYGNSEQRTTDLVFALPDQMLETPVCAVCCSLANLEHPAQWPESTCTALDSMVLDFSATLSVVSGQYTASSSLVAHLSVENADVAESLCKKGLATVSRPVSSHATATQPSTAQPASTRQQPASSTANATSELPPVDIQLGSQRKGFLVHAESPSSFYVQLNDSAQQLDTVSRQLSSTQMSKSLSANWQVGDLCIAVFSEDGGHYRARISAIQGNQAAVLFVDYGNSARCALTDLAPMSSSLSCIPAQAIQCSLSNASPPSGAQWPEQVCKLMQGLVDRGDQMTIKFCQRNEPLWSVKVCDVQNRDFGEFLCSKNMARSAEAGQAAQAQPTSSSGSSSPSQLRPVAIKPGFQGQVTVPHPVSPSEFYCSLQQHAEELAGVMAQLATLYKSSAPPPVLRSAQAGTTCAAQFSADDEWYRAFIQSVSAEGYSVLFVDYGNSETVPHDRVRALPPMFTSLPAQALRCTLLGAPAISGEWEEQILDKFAEVVMEAEFRMEVVSVQSGIYSVRLFNHAGKSLSDVFLARPTSASAQEEVAQPPPSQASSSSAKVDAAVEKVSPSSDCVLYETGFTDSAVLCQFETPQCFFVQMSSAASDLDKIMDCLAVSETPLLQSAESGLWCAACASDKAWYRGQISAVNGSTASIEFIDYGFSEDVDIGNLSELPAGLCTDREALATCCRLDGVEDDVELSDEGYEAAGTLSNQQVQITVKSTQGDGTLVVNALVAGRKMSDILGLSASTPFHLTFGCLPAQATPVMVNHCRSPVDFHCQLCDSASLSMFKSIQTRLADHVKTAQPLSPAAATAGCVCAALSSQDQCWYRATVLEEVDSNHVNVQLVDVGSALCVPKASLRLLTRALCQEPTLAVRSVLLNYEKCIGVQFDAQIRDALCALVLGKQMLTASVHGSCQVDDAEVPVVQLLDVNGVIIADSLKAKTAPVLPPSAPVVPSASPLQVGVQKAMLVSYVQSSSSFWCQPADTADDLSALQDDLATSYGDGSSAQHADSLCAGMCVAALYEDDGGFYRGEIQRVTPRTADVFFLDYGDMKTVKKASIYSLLPQFNSLPRQATLCQLNTTAVIDEDARTLLEEHIDQKEIEVTAVSIDNSAIVRADVLLDGQNVLEFLRSQSVVQEPEVASEPQGSEEVLLTDYSTLLKSGDKHSVRCLTVTSPEEIYVQLVEKDDALAALLDDMNSFYASERPAPVQSNIIEGAFFAAPFSVDNGWYRASVEEVTEGRVSVLFVDYGNKEWCKATDLRFLDKQFTNLPQASFCIALPVDCTGQGWTDDAVAALPVDDSLVLTASIVSSVDGYVIADLTCAEQGIDFTRMLVDSGFAARQADGSAVDEAVPAAIDEATPVAADEATPVAADEATPVAVDDATPVAVDEAVPVAETDGSGAASDVVTQPESSDEVPATPQPVAYDNDQQTGLGIVVSHAVSPFEFWCQPLATIDALNEQQVTINEYVSSVNSVCLQGAAPGCYCLGLFEEDGSWYRARVEDVSDAGSATLLFIDYGNQVETAQSGLLPLPAQFSKAAWFAVKCSLYTVEPPASGESWSESAITSFHEFVDNQELTLNLNGQYEEATMPVTYLVDAMQLDGTTVADQLVSAGVAVSTVASPEVLAETTTLSPCSPTIGSAMQVVVSHVSSPFEVWCQLQDQSDVLDTLSQDLANRYATEDCNVPNLPADMLKPGCLCVAQFSEDSCWYRAHILFVNAEYSEATVRFVDFGNKDTVLASCIKCLVPAFTSQSEQAFQLSLHGIRPLSSEGWEAGSVQHLESLCGGLCDVVLASSSDQAENFTALYYGQMRAADGQDVARSLCGAGLAQLIQPADVTGSTSEPSSDMQVVSIEEATAKSPTSCPGPAQASSTPVVTSSTSGRSTLSTSLVERSVSSQSECSQIVHASSSPRQSLSAVSTPASVSPRSASPALDPSSVESLSCASLTAADISPSSKPQPSVTSALIDSSAAAEGESSADQVTGLHTGGSGAAPMPISISALRGSDIDVRSQSSWSVAATTASEQGDALAGDLIAVGQTVAVEVTHFESPSSFWCQVIANASSLDKLMDILNAHTPVPLEEIAAGGTCCARFAEDDRLYRAVVESESEEGVCVRFTDYGNAQTCARAEVFVLPKSCHTLPLQAIHCELAHAAAVNGGWSSEAEECFHELTGNGAEATLVSGVTQLSVELHANSSNVLDTLIARGLATKVVADMMCNGTGSRGVSHTDSVDMPDSAPVPLVDEPIVTTPVMSADAPVFTPSGRLPSGARLITPVSPNTAASILSPAQATDTQATEVDNAIEASGLSLPPSPSPTPSLAPDEHSADGPASGTSDIPARLSDLNKDALQLSAGQQLDVVVALVSAPTQVWVQAVSDCADLEQLSSVLAERGPSLEELTDGHTVGCVYAAFYSKYDAWYRAQVLAVDQDTCQMFFIDYGNVDSVSFDCIAALPEEIAEDPIRPQAIQCSLSGFADKTLSATDCEAMTQELMDLGNLSLTVVGATDSGCPAVELHCGDINVVEDYFARLQG